VVVHFFKAQLVSVKVHVPIIEIVVVINYIIAQSDKDFRKMMLVVVIL
jgi:hypothetical protein